MIEKLKYFGSLMGVLTGISVFFPYANELAGIVCVDSEYANAVSIITPIVCLFLIFYMFVEGDWNTKAPLIFFGCGLYGVLASVLAPDVACDGGWSLLFYLLAFTGITGAFATLAVISYESRT